MNKKASAYRKGNLGLFAIENEVETSRLDLAISRLIQISLMITIKTKIKNFTVPKKLFRMMPHFRKRAWSKQQNVFAASAIAMILPGVTSAKDASRTFCVKAIEF